MNNKLFASTLLLSVCCLATEKSEKPNPTHLPIESVADTARVSLTLETLADFVSSNNPMLVAARFAVDEAKGSLKQSGRLPNPRLLTQFQNDPRFGEIGGTFGFNQSFPLTGRLRWERKISTALVASAEAEVKDVERRLIAEASATAVQYLALMKRAKLLQGQIRLADELTSYLRLVSDSGEGSVIDTRQAELESAQLVVQSTEVEIKASQLLSILKPIVGLAPEIDFEIAGELSDLSSSKSWSVKLEHRPDYIVANESLRAAEYEIQLERAKRWEDFSVGLFANIGREEDQPFGFEREERAGVNFSIPLPLWNKNEGAIERSQSKYQRVLNSVRALEIQIQNEAAASWGVMKQETELIERIRQDLLPLASAQVVDTENAFKSGVIDLQPVLRARDKRIELELTEVDALRGFHLARVRYEAATGKRIKIKQ